MMVAEPDFLTAPAPSLMSFLLVQKGKADTRHYNAASQKWEAAL